MTQEKLLKVRGMRMTGALLAIFGAVAIFWGLWSGNAAGQSTGLVVCIIGVLLIQRAKTRAKLSGISGLSADGKLKYGGSSRSPGLAVWAWVVGSTLATIASFVALYVDAAYGGHWTWPLYAILATGTVAMCAWGYLCAKMGWFI